MTPTVWEDLKSICCALWQAGIARLRPRRLESTDNLVEFIHSRAAYIGQTSLYGYLKTRVGTQYRDLFQDERFAEAIRQSRGAVIQACLEDLVIYTTAILIRDGGLQAGDAPTCAADLHTRAAMALADHKIPDQSGRVDFQTRALATDWTAAAVRDAAFQISPAALVEHAPVIDDYKALDREIVLNSVRYRWADIREQLSRRLDAKAVVADISNPLT